MRKTAQKCPKMTQKARKSIQKRHSLKPVLTNLAISFCSSLLSFLKYARFLPKYNVILLLSLCIDIIKEQKNKNQLKVK